MLDTVIEGGTVVEAGTLQVAADAQLGAAARGITLQGGGTLAWAAGGGAQTISRPPSRSDRGSGSGRV